MSSYLVLRAPSLFVFLCNCYGAHRDLHVLTHSFPTRRSSDRSRSGHIDRLRKLNLMDPGKAATILTAHREIVTHLQALDLSCAQEAVRRHLSGTLAKVDEIQRAHPEFF